MRDTNSASLDVRDTSPVCSAICFSEFTPSVAIPAAAIDKNPDDGENLGEDAKAREQ